MTTTEASGDAEQLQVASTDGSLCSILYIQGKLIQWSQTHSKARSYYIHFPEARPTQSAHCPGQAIGPLVS